MLQIENYNAERNYAKHTPLDNIPTMNLDYWVEQIKALIAITAHLAILSPVN